MQHSECRHAARRCGRPLHRRRAAHRPAQISQQRHWRVRSGAGDPFGTALPWPGTTRATATARSTCDCSTATASLPVRNAGSPKPPTPPMRPASIVSATASSSPWYDQTERRASRPRCSALWTRDGSQSMGAYLRQRHPEPRRSHRWRRHLGRVDSDGRDGHEAVWAGWWDEDGTKPRPCVLGRPARRPGI